MTKRERALLMDIIADIDASEDKIDPLERLLTTIRQLIDNNPQLIMRGVP